MIGQLGHFRQPESLRAVDCTGIDNQTPTKKIHAKTTKHKLKSVVGYCLRSSVHWAYASSTAIGKSRQTFKNREIRSEFVAPVHIYFVLKNIALTTPFTA